MEEYNKIRSLANSLSHERAIELCNKIIVSDTLDRNDLLTYMDEETYEDIIIKLRIPYYIKQQNIKELLEKNPEIKFTFVEDWKDENRLKFIAFLISLNYVNQSTMHYLVGNKSKKTYKCGTIINDSSLSLKKFFDNEFKNYTTNFNRDLSILISELSEIEGKSFNDIETKLLDIVYIIQADIVCRDKYNKGELEDYKQKISDIIETRGKEDELYELYNKITYLKLVNDNPHHEPLKFLLFNTWRETKERYLWLTELITYINNESKSCKEYLVSVIGTGNHQNQNRNVIKYKLIEDVARIKNFNMNMIKMIKDYMFSVGTYYKHGTYNKWYSKELNVIKLFEKHMNIELSININNLIDESTSNNEKRNELHNLFLNYCKNVERLNN